MAVECARWLSRESATPMLSAGMIYHTGTNFLIPVNNHHLGHGRTEVNPGEIDMNHPLTYLSFDQHRLKYF